MNRTIRLDAAATGRRTRPANRVQSLDQRSWYRITNADGQAGPAAEIAIYDEIGYWGTTAAQFVDELNAVEADQISVRLNSPGGDVFDGVAIYNALVRHPATVTTYADGLAASIASVILQAGEVRMVAKASQVMIHEASALCVGNARDMTDCAAMLDGVSNMIAQVYADRAGGKPGAWRAAMQAETWYSPEEAVTAGLADGVQKREAAENKFDLSVFAYAGREHAPKPPTDMVGWNPDDVRAAFERARRNADQEGRTA